MKMDTMARLPDLMVMAERHNFKICTIKDLIQYRMRNEKLVRKGAETVLPTEFGGDFRLIVYENEVDSHNHVALVKGEIHPDEPILVRVHSECLTGMFLVRGDVIVETSWKRPCTWWKRLAKASYYTCNRKDVALAC